VSPGFFPSQVLNASGGGPGGRPPSGDPANAHPAVPTMARNPKNTNAFLNVIPRLFANMSDSFLFRG